MQVQDISVSILYGVSESAKASGEYKLLRITDIQDNTVVWFNVPYTDFDKAKVTQYLLKDGDIVFARTGATVGKSYIVENAPLNTIYASYLIRIRTVGEVIPNYLKIFFESSFYWQQIYEGSVGIGQPNVNGTSLGLLWLPIPPKTEQVRIVSSVKRLNSIISNLEQPTKKLHENIISAKAKILELAMQGKLVPQDPADEPAAEMLKCINPKAKIITDNPHYPKLRYPESWCLVSIEDINSYKSEIVNPSNTPDKVFEVYSVPTFSTGHPEYLTGQEIGSTKQSVKKDDILLCKINPHLNRVWEVKESSDSPQIASSEWIVVRAAALYTPFLKFYFSSPEFRKLLCSQVSGVGGSLTRAQPAIVKKYYIPLPPLEEQKRISRRITEYWSILNDIEATII